MLVHILLIFTNAVKLWLPTLMRIKPLLLSLLLPSCIVASIRELVNKLFSTSAINLQPLQMAEFPSNMDMDINAEIIRERFTSSSKVSLRELSTHLTASFTPYYKRMEIQNKFLDKDTQEPIDSYQLSYLLNNK